MTFIVPRFWSARHPAITRRTTQRRRRNVD
jgi:hypothetical protein